MTRQQLTTVAVGALIGAVVGALYALAYVRYRDQFQSAFAGLDKAADLPEEPSAPKGKDRRFDRSGSPAFQARMEAARRYREENPGTTWPEAVRKAAQNGGAEVRTDVPA